MGELATNKTFQRIVTAILWIAATAAGIYLGWFVKWLP